MERREMLKTVAGTVAGVLAAQAMAAESTGSPEAHHHHEHGAMGQPYAALSTAAGHCLQAGETCLSHCLVLLGQGEKDMAPCAQAVREMLAVCDALAKLALQQSPFTPAQAKVAAEVCDHCQKACREHADQHAECQACEKACATCAKECRALAA